MSDDTFIVCVYIAIFAVVMLAGYALTVTCFDKDGYWRWPRKHRSVRR